MTSPHPVSAHIDNVTDILPNSATALRVRDAIWDLLVELHEDAASEGASRTLAKIERIADELNLPIITHQEG